MVAVADIDQLTHDPSVALFVPGDGALTVGGDDWIVPDQ
jgi:hypothetical protein